MVSYGQNITSVAYLHQLHMCFLHENDKIQVLNIRIKHTSVWVTFVTVGFFFSLFFARCQEKFERTVCFEHNVNTHLPPEWAFSDSPQVKVIQLCQDQDDLQQQETCVWLHAAKKPLQRRGMHYPSTPNDMGYIQLVCLIAFINEKYPPPSVLPQWQVILRLSRCVSLLVTGSEKHLRSCQELCLYLMWNDTYMTAKKSVHNCSLNNKTKCSRRPHRFTYFFQTRAFLFSLNVWYGDGKHWSLMLMKDAKPNILRAGSGPDPFWSKWFCIFSEDGWTMRFRANKNAAHKSLPGHRG